MIVRAEIVRRPDGQTESQCGIFEAVENHIQDKKDKIKSSKSSYDFLSETVARTTFPGQV